MGMLTLWQQTTQDLRYALRTMAAQPLFTAMAALSLALGIGANTAIYSFMEAILMRSLPVDRPESLARFTWHSKAFPPLAHSFWGNNFKDPKLGMTSGNFPFPAYEFVRAENPCFTEVFAFNGGGRRNLQIRGQADLGNAMFVSGRFFSGLGVPPAAGRLIGDSDDLPGAPAVAVLSYAYATRRFGEAAQAVGQQALVNNTPFTIAGVAAPEFFGLDAGDSVEVYVPLRTSALLDPPSSGNPYARYQDNNWYWVQFMGRLKPGITLAQAQAALAPMFRQYFAGTASTDKERADLPALRLDEGAGGLDFLRRRYSKPLYVLMTMVGLILAIACANLANLLLARSAARRKEMALRLSLGAGRLRLIRQLLTESLLLACLGGAFGVLFAKWGIGILMTLIANGNENFSLRAGLNWNVLGAALALSLATGVLFGLAPSLQASRVDLVSGLKESRAGQPGARAAHMLPRIGLNHVLVVAQVAVSLLMLVGAGLFVRTLSNLHSVQLGFNRERLLLVDVNAKQAGYKEEALARFYQNLQGRFNSIPGVRSGSASNYALVSQSMWRTSVGITGRPPDRNTGTAYMMVGPSFLATMQIPLLLGRDITERDVAAGAKVAVVNEKFAKTYFGGDSPLGRRFGLGGGKNQPEMEIVGVTTNARYSSLKQDIPEVAYVPYTYDLKSLSGLMFELRAAGDPLALTAEARRILREADARVPLSRAVTQAQIIEQTIGQERTFAMLCACFAALALAIACVGLYGLMAYRVARRTNEIGIRVALGAEQGRLIWMVMREVFWMSIAGLAIGLPAAYAASHLVESFLFEMKPRDPLALAIAPAVLLAAALAAGFGPAWRASRIDPCVALREE